MNLDEAVRMLTKPEFMAEIDPDKVMIAVSRQALKLVMADYRRVRKACFSAGDMADQGAKAFREGAAAPRQVVHNQD